MWHNSNKKYLTVSINYQHAKVPGTNFKQRHDHTIHSNYNLNPLVRFESGIYFRLKRVHRHIIIK